MTAPVQRPADPAPPPAGSPRAAPRPPRQPRPLSEVLEAARFLVAIGSITSLLLGAACFVWALVKSGAFVLSLLGRGANEDVALVKLFESVDVILIGTVLLIIGLGLWELFVGDLDLPAALTTTSFDELKGKIATTLLLVLVVRFLETLVSRPAANELLELGVAVTLVGGLLLAFVTVPRPGQRRRSSAVLPADAALPSRVATNPRRTGRRGHPSDEVDPGATVTARVP